MNLPSISVMKKKQLFDKKKNKVMRNIKHMPTKSIITGDKFENHQLIISVDKEEILYYEIFTGSNTATTFWDYFEKLIQEVKLKYDINKDIFFIDNSTVHDSKIMYDFLKDKRIKIIWGVNNFSNLDFCEFIFLQIKIQHYKKIYNST